MSGIQFVPQTGTKQDDENNRKVIRRHVMLGKNQGAPQNPKQPKIEGAAVSRLEDWQYANESVQSVVPRRVGTDLSFLNFADTVELPILSDTLQFCSATAKVMFVLEPCISFASADAMATCIQPLVGDALFLNVMVFSAQAYMDQSFRHTTSEQRRSEHKGSLLHYGKALELLRQRLVDAQEQRVEISDVTIMTVCILAMHAMFTGEMGSARNHVLGLRKLVSTREDGVYSFRYKSRQMVDLLRCDICYSLATGRAPVFFSVTSNERMFPIPELSPMEKAPEWCTPRMNIELAKIWTVLRSFCAMVNTATVNQNKISEQILLETMAAVMYRLLEMSIMPGTTDHAFRLTMLAFCANAFLPWRHLRMPFGWLQREHKRATTFIMQSRPAGLSSGILLWLLMIYGIAFSPLDVDDREEVQLWLTEESGLCGLTSWDGVRKLMGEFLWIDIVCNEPAQKIFHEALGCQTA